MTVVCPDILSVTETLKKAVASREGGAGEGDCPVFRIGPVQVELRSDMADAMEDMCSLYRDMRLNKRPNGPVIQMEIRASHRSIFGRRRYSIYGDGEELFPHVKPNEVLPYLEWAISYRVIARQVRFIQFHAATLAYKGRGVILAGNSGCGKTTLAATLVARGWDYLCDEFAMIDPETLMLQPYPRAMCVKSGSFDVVRRLGLPLWRRRHYVKAVKGPVGYVSPADINVASEPVPVRLIAFPQYRGGQKPWVKPMAGARTAFALASQSFNRHRFGSRTVSILGELVDRAKCVTMEPGDPAETVKVLEDLLEGQPLDGQAPTRD